MGEEPDLGIRGPHDERGDLVVAHLEREHALRRRVAGNGPVVPALLAPDTVMLLIAGVS